MKAIEWMSLCELMYVTRFRCLHLIIDGRVENAY